MTAHAEFTFRGQNMCRTCQTRCEHASIETRSSGCGCGCACDCINNILNALENLFSTNCCCRSNGSASRNGGCGYRIYASSSCENCGSGGFGSCASLNACSDAYYARQYALGYNNNMSCGCNACNTCECNPCGRSNGCNNCNRCHCCND